mmetsp:Transcript_50798/g.120700  ORF Transcript_50798/g.120700 Transcript_50798/m.120700 type:complete len:109 (-) Transcript_50798:159-485(-)|eukprot:CAMPEP_0178443502 /NCGR_PEP_ID=MMETSP0689_2-20121128/38938_1 /TAXON_ID=160604 /ORGANISM="Amphidinium massartii, Strain CS-259" /LENGTH=108 /DNA_ID=CAMNT_0020067531 /DNA_START=1 /DNA_END=327 /DNA_ORIENTATION=+
MASISGPDSILRPPTVADHRKEELAFSLTGRKGASGKSGGKSGYVKAHLDQLDKEKRHWARPGEPGSGPDFAGRVKKDAELFAVVWPSVVIASSSVLDADGKGAAQAT